MLNYKTLWQEKYQHDVKDSLQIFLIYLKWNDFFSHVSHLYLENWYVIEWGTRVVDSLGAHVTFCIGSGGKQVNWMS